MLKNILHFLLFFMVSGFVSIEAQPYKGKIGVGLDGIGGPALIFPNVVKTASQWQSVANNGNAKTDEKGWPIEDFRVVFFDFRPFNAWNNDPDDPAKYVVDVSGTYTLSFKGQATLSSWSDAPLTFNNKSYDSINNTTTLDIVFPPGGGAKDSLLGHYGFMMINFLQTKYDSNTSGIKDIRLIRPGYSHHTEQPFRTEFLNAIGPFSTLRFMDFTKTNDQDNGFPNVQKWQDRQQPDAALFTKGAPWESVIALANLTGKDLWLNIPVDADSFYVVSLAQLIKKSLRSDVNIYLEYSNEVWNGGFTQYKYNYDAVLNAVDDADIRASTPWDDRRRARRVAKQIIKIGKIFENELGVTVASRTKIRPVFAWQIGGWLPWYDDVLTWINTTYGAPKNFIYGIACAPYFGEGYTKNNATPEEVVAGLTIASDSNVSAINYLAHLANQWQIKNLQYEGGPDNGGGSTVNLKNRISANRTQEMKSLVIHNYKDNWFSANGSAPAGTNDLANYFVMSGKVSRYGCWGATEDLTYIKTLNKAPKYDALCVLTGMCGNEPSATLTLPINHAKGMVNTPVTLMAEVSDQDGTVNKVEFFVGSTLAGIDSTAPFSVSWTPSKEGNFAVSAKAVDNDDKYTFSESHELVIEKQTGGISKLKATFHVDIFPNPAHDVLLIKQSDFPNQTLHVEIRDLMGQLQCKQDISTDLQQVDVSDWNYGIYIVTLKKNGLTEIQKIAITH